MRRRSGPRKTEFDESKVLRSPIDRDISVKSCFEYMFARDAAAESVVQYFTWLPWARNDFVPKDRRRGRAGLSLQNKVRVIAGAETGDHKGKWESDSGDGKIPLA